ncbi:MAG: TolC family protein, partial [Bacteroidales bacterium]
MKKLIIILVLSLLFSEGTGAQGMGKTYTGGMVLTSPVLSEAIGTPLQSVSPLTVMALNNQSGSGAEPAPVLIELPITVPVMNNQAGLAVTNKSLTVSWTKNSTLTKPQDNPELKISGNLEKVISEIEKNNTTLQALRQQLEARRLENRTGIFLPDPEAGFNYLWGDPSVIGNRVNIALTQSFDFPTAYKYRNQISHIRNDQLDLEYDSQLRTIRFEARLVLTDLVYYNNMEAEYK